MTIIQELGSNYAMLKTEYLDLYPLIKQNKQFDQQGSRGHDRYLATRRQSGRLYAGE